MPSPPPPPRLSVALLALAACGGAPDPVVIAVQNAGTTPFLDLVAPWSGRATCEDGYSNNLCTADAERALARALADASPTIVSLQEMWHDPWCDDPGRDPAWDAPPFACATRGSQVARVLPAGLHHACAPGYPDNCLAWDPARFTPDLDTAGPDHGLSLTDLTSTCAGPGRVATLSGTFDGDPTTLAVVHLNAGPFGPDQTCRADQLVALDAAIADSPDARWIVAGDFNLDLDTGPGPDRAAVDAMRADHGLRRVPDDGDTSRLLPGDLDAVLVRDVDDAARCTVRFVDDGAVDPVQYDHALLVCGPDAE